MCSILMCDKNSDRMKELAEALEAIDMDNGREKTDEKPPLNKRSPLLIE